MKDNKIIITVSGTDKIGIVAGITNLLAKYSVNIEDIKQTLMQGHFVMFMLCSTENSKISFSDLKDKFADVAKEIGVEIWIQKKEIFDTMHTI